MSRDRDWYFSKGKYILSLPPRSPNSVNHPLNRGKIWLHNKFRTYETVPLLFGHSVHLCDYSINKTQIKNVFFLICIKTKNCQYKYLRWQYEIWGQKTITLLKYSYFRSLEQIWERTPLKAFCWICSFQWYDLQKLPSILLVVVS